MTLTQARKYLSLRTHKLFQSKSPVSILSFWKVLWMTKDLDVCKSHFLTDLLAPWQRALSNTNTILIFPIIHCTTEVWSKQLRGKKNLLAHMELHGRAKLAVWKLVRRSMALTHLVLALGALRHSQEKTPTSWILPGEEEKRLKYAG